MDEFAVSPSDKAGNGVPYRATIAEFRNNFPIQNRFVATATRTAYRIMKKLLFFGRRWEYTPRLYGGPTSMEAQWRQSETC